MSLSDFSTSTLFRPVSLGTMLGFFVGKQLGVFGFAWAVIRCGLADLPAHASWQEFYGIAVLCGIGFTMSLFIGLLAFPVSPELQVSLKLTTTVSTKGQLILPKSIRERRRWPAGTKPIVEDTPSGVLLKAKPAFAPTRPKDVFGSLSYKEPAKSIADMEAGIAAEAKRRHGHN